MSQTMILVPTELERCRIAPVIAAGADGVASVELCGFGPVVAAARTAELIAVHRPPRVLLVGIAGRYAEGLAIGRAYGFEQVGCHGIGAGSGSSHAPAGLLGWPHWPGSAAVPGSRIGDVLPCACDRLPAAVPCARLLLTVCAAAAHADDLRERLALYPEAAAEDMEGFAVAAACRLAGVPLDIVRGISNTAGDRDRSHWEIDAACRAAGEAAVLLLGGRS